MRVFNRARSLVVGLARRHLHDDAVFGQYRPPEFRLPDFSVEELSNRASSPLVRLVDSYRRHGHRAALLDPLNLAERPPVPALDPRRYGFALPDAFEVLPEYTSSIHASVQPTLEDPSKLWATAGILYGMQDAMSIGEVTRRLQEVYCGGIAYEFMHLPVCSFIRLV